VQAWYEPLEIWRQWAHDVRGKAISGGHFLPEENPKEVANELIHFFAETAPSS
jgi:haloacetate dehalogenase